MTVGIVVIFNAACTDTKGKTVPCNQILFHGISLDRIKEFTNTKSQGFSSRARTKSRRKKNADSAN